MDRWPSAEDGRYDVAGSVNPYAPPKPVDYEAKPTSVLRPPIGNRQVEIGAVLGTATEVWKQHLGLLLGVFVTMIGITWAVVIPLAVLQGTLEANREEGAAAVVGLAGNILSNLVQMYLGIGQVQIALKLARGERAEFADLFGGGSRFWPVLGVSILVGLAIVLGFIACIVPGIILAIILWPAYYLVVDDRSTVMDSFSLAYRIIENNVATIILLALASFGINLLGVLALCIGLIFSVPLVVQIWVTAYLMMSGQLHSPLDPYTAKV